MRLFIWFHFVAACIEILARALIITIKEHPRIVTYTKGEDVFLLLLSGVFLVWAGILLFF